MDGATQLEAGFFHWLMAGRNNFDIARPHAIVFDIRYERAVIATRWKGGDYFPAMSICDSCTA